LVKSVFGINIFLQKWFDKSGRESGRRPEDQLIALEASKRVMESGLVLCGVREVASVEV